MMMMAATMALALLLVEVLVAALIVVVIIQGYFLTKSFIPGKVLSVSFFQSSLSPHSTTLFPHLYYHIGEESRFGERT